MGVTEEINYLKKSIKEKEIEIERMNLEMANKQNTLNGLNKRLSEVIRERNMYEANYVAKERENETLRQRLFETQKRWWQKLFK